MRAYYNDIDPFVCDWLEELIKDGQITPGDVDRRNIKDIDPADLDGYSRVHFFAGIGGWDLALTWAGWPDDRQVWTGSCPCQPFSSAGKRRGTDDERHLWPAFSALISERRPATVFGEQVASSDGRSWLAGVFADLEGMGYRAAGADLCAAGVGAPHIRQRLWWVADAESERRSVCDSHTGGDRIYAGPNARGCCKDAGGLADAIGQHDGREPGDGVRTTSSAEREAWQRQWGGDHDRTGGGNRIIECHEPERVVYRRAPIEPGLHPLAYGISACLERLRSIEDQVIQEISDANGCEENTSEVLRMVRKNLYSWSGGKEQPTGVRLELHEASILLGFVLCIEAARKSTDNRSGFSEAGDEARRAVVRGVWNGIRPDDSPCRWRRDEQRHQELANAVSAVSLVLARHVESYRRVAMQANAASSRVGTLRGAGNAIVPQVAAELVAAYLETEAA